MASHLNPSSTAKSSWTSEYEREMILRAMENLTPYWMKPAKATSEVAMQSIAETATVFDQQESIKIEHEIKVSSAETPSAAKVATRYIPPHLRKAEAKAASAHFAEATEVIDPTAFTHAQAASGAEKADQEVMRMLQRWNGEPPRHYLKRDFKPKEAAFHLLPRAIASDFGHLSRMPYAIYSTKDQGHLDYHYDLPCYTRFNGREEHAQLGLIANDRGQVYHYSIATRLSSRLEEILRTGPRPSETIIGQLSSRQPRLEDESFVYYLTQHRLTLIIPKGRPIARPKYR